WRGPRLGWPNTSAPRPPAANTSANWSRYISLTAEKPCAMTTVGTRPVASSGRYSHPRNVTPSSVLNAISFRMACPPHHTRIVNISTWARHAAVAARVALRPPDVICHTQPPPALAANPTPPHPPRPHPDPRRP